MAQPAEKGARPELLCATEDGLKPETLYGPSKRGETVGAVGECRLDPCALDRDAAARLWAISEAVERRVRGGMLLGVGLCFIALTALRPWSTSLPTALFYVMAGALAAPLLGLLVDGVVPKQWLLVAVETVVMAVAALWLWRGGGPVP